MPEFFNGRVHSFDVTKHLRLGTNVIAVEAVNRADGLNLRTDTPAGLFVNLTDRIGRRVAADRLHRRHLEDKQGRSRRLDPAEVRRRQVAEGEAVG